MTFQLCAALGLSATLIAGGIANAAPGSADSAVLAEARRMLETMSEKHRLARSFYLKFEAVALGPDGDALPKFKGSLLSGDSGRFRLEHAQGLVVCDGATLWQYFPRTRQVIIRDAGDASGSQAAGGVLLRFLRAKPLQAKKTQEGLRILLDPATAAENLDSLILILDPVKTEVRRVETLDPAGGRVRYTVKSLKLGARTRAGDFAAPKAPGAEVVDMR